MLAQLLAFLALAAPPAQEPKVPNPPAVAQKPPADITNAVDANGVPAWAKRKRHQPVQSCETRPNIGVETWRQKYDSSKDVLRPRTPTSTCR
jgi:hypothetical protein